MEEELSWLKLILVQYGGIDNVAAIERQALEAVPPLDAKGEIELLLAELEAILVEAPVMVQTTMDSLIAEELRFVPTVQEDSSRRDAESSAGEVRLSRDTMGHWLESAREARAVISGLRMALNV